MREFGSITQLEALRDLGVMRLASRISEIRQKPDIYGIQIKSETIKVKNRYDEDCPVKRYFITERDEIWQRLRG